MLKKLIEKGGILLNPEFTTKEEMFRWIAEDAASKQLITSADEFYTGLIDREEQMSTEVEKGIAIPHTKLDSINELFVYCIVSEKGIKFGGFGSKVKIAFLIGAPRSSQHFLDTMAMIARVLDKKDFREALMDCRDTESVLSLIHNTCRVSVSEMQGKRNMHCLILVLNESSQMDTATKLAIELGIKGIQVFDTTNAAAKIALDFPFLSFFTSKNEQIAAKTLIGITENETITSRLYAHMKKEGIDIMEPGAGILYSIPCGIAFGGIDADYV